MLVQSNGILVEEVGEEFMLVVNASNTQKDLEWLIRHRPRGVDVSVTLVGKRKASSKIVTLQFYRKNYKN